MNLRQGNVYACEGEGWSGWLRVHGRLKNRALQSWLVSGHSGQYRADADTRVEVAPASCYVGKDVPFTILSRFEVVSRDGIDDLSKYTVKYGRGSFLTMADELVDAPRIPILDGVQSIDTLLSKIMAECRVFNLPYFEARWSGCLRWERPDKGALDTDLETHQWLVSELLRRGLVQEKAIDGEPGWFCKTSVEWRVENGFASQG